MTIPMPLLMMLVACVDNSAVCTTTGIVGIDWNFGIYWRFIEACIL